MIIQHLGFGIGTLIVLLNIDNIPSTRMWTVMSASCSQEVV
ncbi:MAG: hypothetical protein ABIF04_08655 [Chloroflexota bacterium]